MQNVPELSCYGCAVVPLYFCASCCSVQFSCQLYKYLTNHNNLTLISLEMSRLAGFLVWRGEGCAGVESELWVWRSVYCFMESLYSPWVVWLDQLWYLCELEYLSIAWEPQHSTSHLLCVQHEYSCHCMFCVDGKWGLCISCRLWGKG